MSDNEGSKKSGYRLEYASSGRAKCTGECESSYTQLLTAILILTAFYASSSRHRSQTVRLHQVVAIVYQNSRSRRCKGTPIGKGELRFGSVVDFQGKTSL